MRENKSFASLSSGLLARKGAAKPAMRPQGFNTFGANLEDLGWDDMGHEEPDAPAPPTPVCGLTPVSARPAEQEIVLQPRSAREPAVVVQQRALEQSFAAADVVTLPPRRGVAGSRKTKAAFTLRLEAERHLRLRLACALTRRSAQHLVTEAVDQFLDSLPELGELAERLPAEAAQRSR
jgi:hypothetical protein